jgi:hypothetical protein
VILTLTLTVTTTHRPATDLGFLLTRTRVACSPSRGTLAPPMCFSRRLRTGAARLRSCSMSIRIRRLELRFQ